MNCAKKYVYQSCRLLKRNGITTKKIVFIARQRCLEHRAKYMANILIYSVDWLVFLDDTGCDNKDGIRKQGYSFFGESPISFNFLSPGTRTSAIAVLSKDGLICYELFNGTTNGEFFLYGELYSQRCNLFQLKILFW